jgi:hypothetical protein
MFDVGGSESFIPSEGDARSPEQIREAQQRFAGTSGALQQIARDEKKAKKRDDGVAAAILRFLTDQQKIHLATLISRLVARDCPSSFILAILSLINDECRKAAEDYLKEQLPEIEEKLLRETSELVSQSGELDATENMRLASWVQLLELTLDADGGRIVTSLLIDRDNIDGTVLQLTTFVLQDHLQSIGKETTFEQLQPIAGGILQSLFEPHMKLIALQTPPPSEESTDV